MVESVTVASAQDNNKIIWRDCLSGMVEMLPLCLAVLPWGILAGSMAVQMGLSLGQSFGMSALVFAGAAQLVTLGLLGAGAGPLTIIISVFFITSQHFLYGLTLREYAALLRTRYRLLVGFWLTDELFALSCAKDRSQLTLGYMLGAGGSFYISWLMFSVIGIVMATRIPNLNEYHLDFSIVATFITIVVPMIKTVKVLAGVVLSLTASMLLAYHQVEGAAVIGGLIGMFGAVLLERLMGERV